MATVSGTFSGTGDSAEVSCARANISMVFAGTATVNVQWKPDGVNWATIDSYTASDAVVYEGAPTTLRLNCSAHTDDVTYVIATG